MLIHLLSALAVLVPPSTLHSDAETSARLEAGLDEIRAEWIAADIRFFSDDEMAGRDTPSSGLRAAARYVSARLERVGFTPGAGESWFHTYPIHHRAIAPESSTLAWSAGGHSFEWTFGEDYFLYSLRQIVDVEVTGPVYFCGSGNKSELKDVPFADGPVWALCEDTGGSIHRMMRNAGRAGAAGLLVVPPLESDDDPYLEELARTTAAAQTGVVSRHAPSPRSDVPTIFLSRRAARALFGLGPDERPTRPEPGTALGVEVHETREAGGPIDVENVTGLWPGSDPVLSNEVIVVSAHYDHVGTKGDAIFNGADDNATGSMGLLALAEGLEAYGPMRRSILLMWVSGEEKGLWGSEAWTQDPILPDGARVVCNINIDMIGRNEPEYLMVTPTKSHPSYNGLTRLTERLAPLEGFGELQNGDEFWARSDHLHFARTLEVPVMFLHTGEHPDYHQPSDTADKIDNDKVRRVTRLVLRMLDGLQSDELDL